MKLRTLLHTFTAAALVCSTGVFAQEPAAAAQPQNHLPRLKLRVGKHPVEVQLANTPQAHTIGLMYRKHMPTNEGMLFAFERSGIQCFWMKNTLLPLTAAFIDDDGRIVNLADMQPQTENNHCSAKPVRYVLEMNQGWFKQHGVKAGDVVRNTTPR